MISKLRVRKINELNYVSKNLPDPKPCALRDTIGPSLVYVIYEYVSIFYEAKLMRILRSQC